MEKKLKIETIDPDNFDIQNHFYPKVLNTQIHPVVNYFLNLSKKQILIRYLHLNPKVDEDFLEKILNYKTKHFFWGGSDLFYTTTEKGNKKMVVLETNSCPSGQKSMPMRRDDDEQRGYRNLIENSFLPELKKRRLPKGSLAVIYDKNYMEVSGYASAMADLTGEKVYLIEFHEKSEKLFFKDGILTLKEDKKETQFRAVFRYVTQRPWNRIPPQTKTFVYNSTLCCLSGGRNKLLANKAYELLNGEIQQSGLKINIPETIQNVSKLEVPLWVKRFGGMAVVKDPYSNAGQGVYTITTESELENFLEQDHLYDQFIVQALIGHYNWSSNVGGDKFYHVGTLPDLKNRTFVSDIRFMVFSGPKGFSPCALYSRKAAKPLPSSLPKDSWEVLGTNLSGKSNGAWTTDTSRLILMDRKDFNSLGVGVDDLIEGYIQTILSIIAIDKMAENLLSKKGQFRLKLFKSMDNDKSLLNEILMD